MGKQSCTHALHALRLENDTIACENKRLRNLLVGKDQLLLCKTTAPKSPRENMAVTGYGKETFHKISPCDWFYHVSDTKYKKGDTVAFSDWETTRKDIEEVMEKYRPETVGVSRKQCTYVCLPALTPKFEERQTYIKSRFRPFNPDTPEIHTKNAYRVKIIQGSFPCMHLTDANHVDASKRCVENGWEIDEYVNNYWNQPEEINERDSECYEKEAGYGGARQEVLVGPQQNSDLPSLQVLDVLEGTSQHMAGSPTICLINHAEQIYENAIQLWAGTLGMGEPSKKPAEYLMRLDSNKRLFNDIKQLTDTLHKIIDKHQLFDYGEEFDDSLKKIKATLLEIHEKYMAYEKDDQAAYVEIAKKDLEDFMKETCV